MQPPIDTSDVVKKSSQDYSTRLFLFALELIPYFGLPALIGYFVHKRVELLYPNAGFLATFGIFFTSYVVSWVIVIVRYRSVTRQMKQ